MARTRPNETDARATTSRSGGQPPLPPPPQDELLQALTFFLTRGQRTSVLRALRRHGADRSAALLDALRVDGHR